MKILIFGSSGAYGTALETVCRERKIKCIGLTHKDIEITGSDDIDDAIKKYEPDVVVNAVAIIGINLCEFEPERSFAINSIAVLNMAKVCERRGIILVQPSTHAVFDGTKEGFYTEEDLPNPINVYAASKYAGECFARNICRRHYIVRFPTMFGDRRNSSLGFVDKMLDRIRQGKELKVAYDKIDSPSYTRDLANVLIKILEEGRPIGVYHLANEGRVSYYDFIMKLCELLGVDARVMKVKDDEFESLGRKSLKTAIRSNRLDPIRSWEDALAEYVDSLKRR